MRNNGRMDTVSELSFRLCLARCAVVLLLFTLPPGAVAADEVDLSEAFERGTLVIEAGENACYRFDVWLAETSDQQHRGLMYVRELPRFEGMLFIYPEPARLSMWMKNTYIPLDILFIRADGTVASIAAETEPLSLESIASSEPVQYVLELNAGVTQTLGIGLGSRIYLPPGS